VPSLSYFTTHEGLKCSFRADQAESFGALGKFQAFSKYLNYGDGLLNILNIGRLVFCSVFLAGWFLTFCLFGLSERSNHLNSAQAYGAITIKS